MMESGNDNDEAGELSESFFEAAILVRPGESLLAVVQRERSNRQACVGQASSPSGLGDEG